MEVLRGWGGGGVEGVVRGLLDSYIIVGVNSGVTVIG